MSPEQIEAALDQCAREPVHTPGCVQAVGALLAYDMASRRIRYASANLGDLLGAPPESALGAEVGDVLGSTTRHALRNAEGLPSFAQRREPIGVIAAQSGDLDLHAFRSGDHVVVEMEPITPVGVPVATMVREIAELQRRVLGFKGEIALFRSTTRLLKAASGYDRVMAYRFDESFNGEVIAEARKPRLESFEGLRFPHWDIPPQAREIMRRVPVRFIADVDAEPAALLGLEPDQPPLDITFAQTRGVSPVHLQYLRNLGSRATMTFSVVVDQRLWGMISFHHQRPRTPSPHLRQLGELLLPVIETALTLSLEQQQIELLRRANRLRDELERTLSGTVSMASIAASMAEPFLEAFEADGVAISEGDAHDPHGATPPLDVVRALVARARSAEADVVAVDNIAATLGVSPNEVGPFGGALSARAPDGRALTLFRRAKLQSVSWAGAPEKDVEIVDGVARLSPRGSFATYQETVRGAGEPWRGRHLELARQLWRIIASAEQKHAIEALARKQTLLVDELNHRVRNIVALIRSVSRQARRHSASLDSYQRALEARISALAAAHDLGAGDAKEAVSLKQLLLAEAEPYVGRDELADTSAESAKRLAILGDDYRIAAPQAPLVALVIHELMTNAMKYGALSVLDGRVQVSLAKDDDGLSIGWSEHGGPPVARPDALGFGATLIEKAVPFELGGRAELHFERNGLSAEIWLPETTLARPEPGAALEAPPPALAVETELRPIADAATQDAVILILEDNFVIATDMEDVLRDLGFRNVEVSSSAEDALAALESLTVDAAILDVNLGEGRGTSRPVAEKLAEQGVPFAYATGYGSRVDLSSALKDRTILTKPVTAAQLRRAVLALLERPDG